MNLDIQFPPLVSAVNLFELWKLIFRSVWLTVLSSVCELHGSHRSEYQDNALWFVM